MKTTSQDVSASNGISGDAEATLRLIANLPAPEGLEDRVKAGLRSAPRTARVLQWTGELRPSSGFAADWMRGAAAAAIVFVVAGGAWGIYSRVQPTPSARGIVMPARNGAGGGFSNAGAMRTPQTLNGPVVIPAANLQTPRGKVDQKQAKPTVASQTQAASKTGAQPETRPTQ